MRVILVDDEAPAREKLRRYLSARADFELLGEAADGPEALSLIEEHQPDLLLLDIQMPGMTGFDLLRLLPAENRPAVIFATAYDAYAVKAFDHCAADYLLKPFGEKRFGQALDRVVASLEQRPDVTARVLEHLEPPEHAKRLAVRHPAEAGLTMT